MVTLLHVSDLHFGRPHRPEVRAAVERAVGALGPDAVVVSGDIVQHAESTRAWQAARAFIHGLPVPWLSVPGNHDIARWNLPVRLLAPFRNYERFIHPERNRVLRVDGAVLVGLATPRRWTFELGYVSAEQLDFARRAFAAAEPGALRVVVLHHGLAQRGRLPLRRDHVRGSARAVRELDAMGADLAMSGHNHHPHVQRFGGLLWSQAGTATSRRFHFTDPRRNSFSLVRAAGDALEIDWHIFEPATGEFVPGARHRFERRAR